MPKLVPIIYQKENPTNTLSSTASPSTNELKKVNLKIEGMDCASCAIGIENAIKDLSGVSEAKVEYPWGDGLVIYNPQLSQRICQSKIAIVKYNLKRSKINI